MCNNINKRIDMILEVWQMEMTFANLSVRINSPIKYIQKDLENDEMFYKEALTTFTMKVLDMNERKEKHLMS